MAFTLNMATDNSAFDDVGAEVVRILQTVIYRIEGGTLEGNCQDSSGNTVGAFKLNVWDERGDDLTNATPATTDTRESLTND